MLPDNTATWQNTPQNSGGHPPTPAEKHTVILCFQITPLRAQKYSSEFRGASTYSRREPHCYSMLPDNTATWQNSSQNSGGHPTYSRREAHCYSMLPDNTATCSKILLRIQGGIHLLRREPHYYSMLPDNTATWQNSSSEFRGASHLLPQRATLLFYASR